MRIKIVIFILVSFLFFTCVEFDPVSPIPEIEYKDLTFGIGLDSLGNRQLQALVEFSFIDGDADLGVYDEVHSDTLLPDSVRYGIFIDMFEKVNDDYRKIHLIRLIRPAQGVPYIDTFQLHTLLPYDEKMDRVGQNKAIQGIIRSGIVFYQPADYDTMRLEFYIRDRALNKSNVEYTRDFAASEMDTTLYVN